MTFLEARSLDEPERPALVAMLAQEHAAGWLVDQLRRRSPSFDDFAVWSDGAPVGALRGNTRTSFAGNNAFDEFELPRGPHAFLSGIFIATQARGTDAAALLVRSFVLAAEERGATFIAGTMDRSFDGGVRRGFFEKCGFVITLSQQFGAPTDDLLGTLSSL
ncbi:GNAT family N-acetyltransferase [Microbacterium sp. MYb62]|uniref:GNAT family N-acetyltransferase n=1 Tax=Microbacterium sp. MYb62 TaxID=1848690 RepID=UPI0015E331D4|nr:GNAT family N-acetyltransferase [Microbacterium sp. MYb62]